MEKKIPMRMCVACREMKPKKDMLRIVKEPSGEVSIDFTGRKNGRGAYICSNGECIKKLKKQKTLNRVFSMEISGEVYDRIEEEFLGK